MRFRFMCGARFVKNSDTLAGVSRRVFPMTYPQ